MALAGRYGLSAASHAAHARTQAVAQASSSQSSGSGTIRLADSLGSIEQQRYAAGLAVAHLRIPVRQPPEHRGRNLPPSPGVGFRLPDPA